MNEVVRIDESNIVSILNSWKGSLGIGRPFSKQIYLISARIAGAFYVDNISELLEELKEGSKLHFFREPENKYDNLAIIVKNHNKEKLGYVPRENNPILARLMDAGKLIYGTLKKIENNDSYIDVEMEIYMDD